MKKTFNISYTFTGGERHLQYTEWKDFVDAINRLDEDPHVIQSSIKVTTEEVKV